MDLVVAVLEDGRVMSEDDLSIAERIGCMMFDIEIAWDGKEDRYGFKAIPKLRTIPQRTPTNKYRGKCSGCGELVGRGCGYLQGVGYVGKVLCEACLRMPKYPLWWTDKHKAGLLAACDQHVKVVYYDALSHIGRSGEWQTERVGFPVWQHGGVRRTTIAEGCGGNHIGKEGKL